LGIKVALLLSVLPLILLGITGNAFAQQQAGSGPGTTGGLLILANTGDEDALFDVGGTISACDPITDCAPIVKLFTHEANFKGRVLINEDWTVGTGPPWWDWHEVIQSPGWQFQQVEIFSTNGLPCGAIAEIIAPLPGVIDPTGQEIWIDFDNVPHVGLLTPGDHLCIAKEVLPLTTTDALEIWEWPTIHIMAVGGDIIPLETTMVLVAGAQYTAAWMIPAIVSAIGIGIVLARKF